MKTKDYFSIAFFFLGVFLIGNNIWGSFVSLRNPDIYTETNTGFVNDITLTEKELNSIINSDSSNPKEYVTRVNEAVFNGIADYWAVEGAEKYNLRIPFRENYILYLSSYIWPEKFNRYEFADYCKAIERGVGMCSQHAIILSEVLYEKGIKSKIISLFGHVISTAQVNATDDEWWVLDPLYGVVVPFSIEKIEQDPNIITSYYADKGYDRKSIEAVRAHYEDGVISISKGYGMGDFNRLTAIYEKISYVMIWIIPMLLMMPVLIHMYQWRGAKRLK